jgi:hypothetical protein
MDRCRLQQRYKKTSTKISILLVVIFLLSAGFFSIYQLNSQNKNERIIEEIYENQLNAIFFSIHQYPAYENEETLQSRTKIGLL